LSDDAEAASPFLINDTLLYVVSMDNLAGKGSSRLRGIALALDNGGGDGIGGRLAVSLPMGMRNEVRAVTSPLIDGAVAQVDGKTLASGFKVSYASRVLPKDAESDGQQMLIQFGGKDGRGRRIGGVGLASGSFRCSPRQTCESTGQATMEFAYQGPVPGSDLPVARGTASFKGSDEELQAVVWLYVSR
jgi:hypothetical protein